VKPALSKAEGVVEWIINDKRRIRTLNKCSVEKITAVLGILRIERRNN
jgi:hypothetical protein